MANLTTVVVTAGIPNQGNGTVSTLDGAAGWLLQNGGAWTSLITSTTILNSLAGGNAILTDLDITNGSTLDRFMDLSLQIGSAPYTGSGANIAFYLYPLNDDGTHYGDGRFTSATTGPPIYSPCAIIPIPQATGTAWGESVGAIIPPGTFRVVIMNNAGTTIAATANSIKYRTYR